MKKLRITVENKTYDVTVEVLSDDTQSSPTSPHASRLQHATNSATASAPQPRPAAQPKSAPQQRAAAGAITSPLAGVVLSILVEVGDQVESGQPLVVLEAMKMENRVSATVAGTVKGIEVAEGESVLEGHVLVVLE